MPPLATYATFYANPDPIYKPAMRLVSAITQAENAAITTTFAHNYVTGLIVRMYVPHPNVFGMPQMDKKVGTVTVTGDDTFTITVDSSLFDAFTYVAEPHVLINSAPMVIPIGEVNSSLSSAVKNTLRS